MRSTMFGYLLLLLLISCAGRSQEALRPRHIEKPAYPPLLRMARIAGKVELTLTIDADGKVRSAEATRDKSGYKPHPLLEAAAIANVEKWTFSKPWHAPFTHTIILDYEIDETIPRTAGRSIERVHFDLPDRVKIVSNAALPQPEQSETR